MCGARMPFLSSPPPCGKSLSVAAMRLWHISSFPSFAVMVFAAMRWRMSAVAGASSACKFSTKGRRSFCRILGFLGICGSRSWLLPEGPQSSCPMAMAMRAWSCPCAPVHCASPWFAFLETWYSMAMSSFAALSEWGSLHVGPVVSMRSPWVLSRNSARRASACSVPVLPVE